MRVPFGALPGFSIAAEIRLVGSYYGIAPRSLRRRDPRHGEHVEHARDALHWRLTVQRGLSPQVAARLLDCIPHTVKAGAARHAERIERFKLTANADTAGAG